MKPDHNPINSIACVGEAMIELTPLSRNNAAMSVAGDVFNTAVYLRRLQPNVPLDFVTALGDDRASDMILGAVQSHDLGTSHIERRPGMSPGMYMIFTDEQGERSFSYWRSTSAARTLFMSPGAVPMATLKVYDLVYFSGITLAVLSEAAREDLLAWSEAYRAAGGIIAFDSNFRPTLWPDRALAQHTIERMWRQCDIALPSVDDEKALIGDPTEAEVIKRLAGYGVTFGALKRGARGPLALDGFGELQQSGPNSNVVDTTAAGDSFNAGFLAGVVAGKSTFEAMQQGHDLAGKVIGHRGAVMPNNQAHDTFHSIPNEI